MQESPQGTDCLYACGMVMYVKIYGFRYILEFTGTFIALDVYAATASDSDSNSIIK